jgi:hypothetical protein
METLNIRPTPQSFEISCEGGLIEVKGCSIINDPKVFFKPLQTWIRNYLKDPSDKTIINLKIDYIDTPSIRVFLDHLKLLEKININGRTVSLNWYYDPNDQEILKLGEILSSRLSIPFNFIRV